MSGCVGSASGGKQHDAVGGAARRDDMHTVAQ
jgi:hypothetical protein